MAGFEDLIRGALIKQGDPSSEVRAKVYASARQALKRMIESNPSLGEEVIAAQRVKLESAINGIERSYVEDDPLGKVAAEPIPVAEPPEPEQAEPKPPESQPAEPEPAVEPEPISEKPAPQAEPVVTEDVVEVEPDKEVIEEPEKPEPETAASPDPAPEPIHVPPEQDETPSQPEVSSEETPVTLEPEPESEPEPEPELKSESEPEIETEPSEPEIAIPKIPLSAPPVVAAATAGIDADVFVESPPASEPISAPEPLVAAKTSPFVTDITADPVDGPTGSRANARVEPDMSDIMDTELVLADEEPKVLQPVRLQTDPPEEEIYPDTYRGTALKEKKPYAKLLLWTIILAGIGVAIWWAINFGPALLKAQLDGSVPNPQPTIESGSFVPGAADQEGWITIFTPDVGAENVVPKGNSAVELQRNGARQIMRMASSDGKVENNVLVKVPRSVMEAIKGQAATIEITVSSPTAENQEYVLFCEFSQMGNCGRKRFTAAGLPEATVFDVLVNDVALPAGEDAFISINTDFSGQGRSLDLHSIRVRVGS